MEEGEEVMSMYGKEEEDTPVQQLANIGLIEHSIKDHGKGLFQLVGKDGNAHSILGRVAAALKRKGWSPKAVNVVINHMTSGDYNHLLRVAVSVQDPRSLKLEALASEMQELEFELEMMRDELEEEDE
tara:strand:+ start:840 stop:1223 length:384 start_codon:yes stop_codon:yes gene_type:complete